MACPGASGTGAGWPASPSTSRVVSKARPTKGCRPCNQSYSSVRAHKGERKPLFVVHGRSRHDFHEIARNATLPPPFLEPRQSHDCRIRTNQDSLMPPRIAAATPLWEAEVNRTFVGAMLPVFRLNGPPLLYWLSDRACALPS